jgi:hypothetical protein
VEDEDWIQFPLLENKRYSALLLPMHPSTAAILTVYGPDGSTVIAESRSKSFGDTAFLSWMANQDGNYYLRVRHIDGRVTGDDVRYRIWVYEGYRVYQPTYRR